MPEGPWEWIQDKCKSDVPVYDCGSQKHNKEFDYGCYLHTFPNPNEFGLIYSRGNEYFICFHKLDFENIFILYFLLKGI